MPASARARCALFCLALVLPGCYSIDRTTSDPRPYAGTRYIAHEWPRQDMTGGTVVGAVSQLTFNLGAPLDLLPTLAVDTLLLPYTALRELVELIGGGDDLTAEELRAHAELRGFHDLDRDADGFLDGTERRRAPALADTDGDDRVSFQEYRDALRRYRHGAMNAEAEAALRRADTDRSGSLSEIEWPVWARTTFAEVDTDEDGLVTPREVEAFIHAADKSPF